MAMSANLKGFKKTGKLNKAGNPIRLKGELPGENAARGEAVNISVTAKDSKHEKTIQLTKKIAEGGEGAVFQTSIKGYVAKIYFRDRITTDRSDKLRIMIDNPISCEGVCFPEALILNPDNEFVGYLMREARGHELGKSIFQPKLFLRKFPNWTKSDSIDLCLTILKKVAYLNSRNVIIGDINPANILVVSPKEVYFVDCDSYQIEGYPCPVGTANYTAPEAQGRDYKTFLRTQEMENFAVATLMFMIMLPGKPPYSAKGGESPEKNIANGVFPYPLTEDTNKTPPGKWGFIWSHMSYRTKEAFFQTFRRGEKHFAPSSRYNAQDWIDVFEKYRYSIDKMAKNDPMAKDVFPTRKKGDYVVERRRCKKCGNDFPITFSLKDWEQRKTEQQGSPVRIEICDDCKAGGNRAYTGRNTYEHQSSRLHPSPKTSTVRMSSKPAVSSRTSKTTSKSAQGSSKIQGYTGGSSKSQAQSSQQNTQKKSNASKVVAIIVAVIIALWSFGTCSQGSSTKGSSNGSSSSSSSQATAGTLSYQAMRTELDGMSVADLESIGYFRCGAYPTAKDGTLSPIYWVRIQQTESYTEYVSVFVLDWLQYNKEDADVAWTNTSLYKWLNTDFLTTSFSDSERAQMVTFEEGDLVSLLDLTDIDLAYENGVSSSAFPTPYALSKGAEDTWEETDRDTGEVTKGLVNWWIRYLGDSNVAPTAYEWSTDEHLPLTQYCGVAPAIRVAR